MSSLNRAFGEASRSLLNAKAAVSNTAAQMLARGPSGVPTTQTDLSNAQEQLRHFRGHVFAAVRPIAQKIAGQTLRVGRLKSGRTGTKGMENVKEDTGHPLLALFSDPNPLMCQFSLIFNIVASLELTGRSLLFLPKAEAIWPVPVHWLRSMEGTAKITAFNVQPPHSGETIPLAADSCVYFAYPNPGDPHGATSPLQAVAGAVDSDEAIVTAQASAFRRGLFPSHALILGDSPHPDFPASNGRGASGIRPRLSETQQHQVIEAVRRRYSGVVNAGEPLILDALISDIKSLSSTVKEMDFLQSGTAARERIFMGFGTNPIVAGLVEGSNRASSDASDRHFADVVCNPKIELISQTLTSWCRYIYNDPQLVVWLEKIVANDADTSIKYLQLLAQYSAITGDELRALAPFDLEQGKFPNPVVPGKSPAEQSLDDATAGLASAVDEISPTRQADRLLEIIGGDRHRGNGKH